MRDVSMGGYSRADFERDMDVSRETLAGFDMWTTLLSTWNARINLVSKSSLTEFWGRHALDSWQLTPLIPNHARRFIDLGSGAGFPGLALALYGRDHINLDNPLQNFSMTLVESAGKKASFLRTVIRELDLPARVTSQRAEHLPRQSYDVISARAFAPLPRLLTYAHNFWDEGTIGLFLKGQGVAEELTQAQKSWTFDVEDFPSHSSETGIILKISGLRPRS